MGRGASYWPQYANDWVPPPPPPSDVWRPRGYLNQYTGQGDYGSPKPPSFNAYATVDAWRSYREDRTTLSGERNNQTLNATASEISPTQCLANHLQLQSNPHFKPYEPLRFSNGTFEAHPVRSFRNPGLNLPSTKSRHSYSTRPVATETRLQNSIHDRPLASIEPGADSNLEAQASLSDFRRDHIRKSTPRRTPKRIVSPPPAPEASEVYLAQARLPPVKRSTPKKCLVILDLNGTCIARPNLFEPQAFCLRPGIQKLFDYLFEHHVVMIFTSMRRKNAAAIVDKLFSASQREKLAGFWARDKLGLTAEQLYAKTQTYKNLTPIWLDDAIQSTHPVDEGRWGWDQSNTVLIDDSHLKAVSHPHNLLLVPEFGKKDAAKDKLHPVVARREEAILHSLLLKLEDLRYQTDVSRLILQWQTGETQIPQEPRSILEMKEKIEAKSEGPVQLLTPESTIDTLSEDSQDDEVHLRLSAQMKMFAEDEGRRARAVSEIPETVWTDLLNGTPTKSS